MTITRPHNAKDNEFNLAMNEIIDHYAIRHNETIKEKEIYTYSVIAKTESGKELVATKAVGCMSSHQNVRNYLYLKEIIDGKHKRIKKVEW